MQASNILAFTCAAAASFSLLLPRESKAGRNELLESSACATALGSELCEPNALRHGASGTYSLASECGGAVVCPVPDRWDFAPQGMTTVEVFGYSPTSISANPQTVYWGSNTGGRSANLISGHGNFELSFAGFFGAADAADFKSIWVIFPNDNGASTLRGLYFST